MDVLTEQVRASRRLGHYLVGMLHHLEAVFHEGGSQVAVALAEFDGEWQGIQKTLGTLTPLFRHDVQIAQICSELPISATSIFHLRVAPKQRLEWLLVALEANSLLRSWDEGRRFWPLKTTFVGTLLWRLGRLLRPPDTVATLPRAFRLQWQQQRSSLEVELRLREELARAYMECRDFQRAILQYRTVNRLARLIGEPGIEARSLGNLAVVYAETHVPGRAFRFNRAALERARTVGDLHLYADQLRLKGTICVDAADSRQALHLLFEALEIHSKERLTRDIAIDLGEIGVAFAADGGVRDARAFLEEAASISDRLGDEECLRTWTAHLQRLEES